MNASEIGSVAADAPPAPSWLFSHTADEGEIREEADGSLELVLRAFDPHVTAFTDRPVRDARIETVEWLVESWSALFSEDPPNAVLVEHDTAGAAQSVVLTLLAVERVSDELRFTVTVIEPEAGSDVDSIAGVRHDDPVRLFQAVSLFIDDVAISCALGGACVVGDTGPGGGVVFYAPKRQFTSEVSDCVSSCRYMEAAPADLGGSLVWDAAMAGALEYVGNGLTDWYLPTKSDLNELYLQRGKVGGFAKDYYWSSDEAYPGTANRQYFSGGQRGSADESTPYRARPIRAFG